jgi:hypothetical protein
MIESPEAIRFSNEQIRPMADRLAKCYYAAKQLVNNWNDQNLASVLPPGDATVVDDGSATDGRHPISADNAYGIVLQANALVTSMEASNGANLAAVLLAAVNVNP